jgi:hypothetical protein
MAGVGTARSVCLPDATDRRDLDATTTALDSPDHPRVRFAITGWRSTGRSVERSRERSRAVIIARALRAKRQVRGRDGSSVCRSDSL